MSCIFTGYSPRREATDYLGDGWGDVVGRGQGVVNEIQHPCRCFFHWYAHGPTRQGVKGAGDDRTVCAEQSCADAGDVEQVGDLLVGSFLPQIISYFIGHVREANVGAMVSVQRSAMLVRALSIAKLAS